MKKRTDTRPGRIGKKIGAFAISAALLGSAALAALPENPAA